MHRPTLGAGAAPTGVPAAAATAGWAVISLHESIPNSRGHLSVMLSIILGKILFSPQSRRWSPARHLAHCAHSRTGASTDKILMKAWIKTKVDYVSKQTDGVPLFSLRRPPLSDFHFLSDTELNTLILCVFRCEASL